MKVSHGDVEDASRRVHFSVSDENFVYNSSKSKGEVASYIYKYMSFTLMKMFTIEKRCNQAFTADPTIDSASARPR